MTKAELKQVEQHYIRFLRSGLKPKFFTNVLYQAFYIDSNLFIAHFNKLGFLSVRFGTPKGLVETVHVLLNGTPKNDTHRILREVTKDHIQYLEDQRQSLLGIAIKSKYAEIDELEKSVNRIFDSV